MPQRGATVWFTGIPSSGKSTIAREVYQQLLNRGVAVELLDGTEVRESLSRGLGFSKEDREEHIRRIGYVARLLSRNGVVAICAVVSPYRASRDEIRRKTTNFVEVYVECPVEVAESRDEEGVYAMARRGEIEDFTGVTGVYEEPEAPEVHIRSGRETVEAAAAQVLSVLERLGVSGPPSGRAREAEEEIQRRLASLGFT